MGIFSDYKKQVKKDHSNLGSTKLYKEMEELMKTVEPTFELENQVNDLAEEFVRLQEQLKVEYLTKQLNAIKDYIKN